MSTKNPLRKSIMLGTAGHVDHGKTSLVKLLTGCETDTLAEEKSRGLTIDLGFAPCKMADERIVGVVDVPGHVDFIRNMVAGAHGIDVVIFVVAADDGIMPQTHEHLHILTLMGLKHGLVALTKIDLVEPARRETVINDLRQLLAGTFLAEAPICPMSNTTGEGFEYFYDSLNAAVAACAERPGTGRFRMWVEDVFTIRGAGTVITGIPTRGTVRQGQTLRLLPAGTTGHVRRMQVYGADATEAHAGECVALNVPDLNHDAVRRGMILGDVGNPEPVSYAEGELVLLPAIKQPIEGYPEIQLHVGTSAVLAHMALLKSDILLPGQAQMVQLRLEEPLPLAPGERFVVRANLPGSAQGLTTIGGGRIYGLSNLRLRRKRPWTLAALAARKEAVDTPELWLETVVQQSEQPLTLADIQRQCWSSETETVVLVERLVTAGRLLATPQRTYVHSAKVTEVAERIHQALEAFHTAHPQRPGMPREELFAAAGGHAEVFALAVQHLVGAKRVFFNGSVFTRPGWAAQLPEADQRFCTQIEEACRAGSWACPQVAELVTALGQPQARIEKFVLWLQQRGILVKLDAQVFMHRDAVEKGKEVALQFFRRGHAFTTMEFRDMLAVSRKYAVPLLDYFDKIRFTVRSGNQRTPGVEARKLLGKN